MAAGVVRVHTQIMAEAVREKRHARPVLENLILVSFQNADIQQPLNRDLMRHGMHVIPQDPRPQHPHTHLLHPQHRIVHPPTLGTEPPPYRKRPRHIRRIAPKLRPRIQQQILPPLQPLAILLIMQRRRIPPRRDDRMVRLLPGAVRDAGVQEAALELALVARGPHTAQHIGVCERRDGVGFADEGDFVRVFDDAAFVDGGLEGGEVLGVEGEEGDVVGDLVLDGPDGSGVRGAGGLGAEVGVDLGGGEDGVDVVEGEGFFGREREAGPDYGVRVDGRDEEG